MTAHHLAERASQRSWRPYVMPASDEGSYVSGARVAVTGGRPVLEGPYVGFSNAIRTVVDAPRVPADPFESRDCTRLGNGATGG